MIFNYIFYIAGIIIAILLFISTISTYRKEKKEFGVIFLGILISLALMGSSIGSFFIPEEYSYIGIILLLVVSICYLIYYYLIVNDKKTQKPINNS